MVMVYPKSLQNYTFLGNSANFPAIFCVHSSRFLFLHMNINVFYIFIYMKLKYLYLLIMTNYVLIINLKYGQF